MKYQRRSRGGSFKKLSASDGGIRAFQDQQKIIIDSLKLQQARSQEYSNQYLTKLKGTHASEKENRRILQNLENQYYEHRRSAVELRGKREVEALESRAAEYGKDAKFWAEFAPKFAEGLAKSATALTDHISHQNALQLIEEGDKAGYWDRWAEYGSNMENQQIVDGIKLRSEAQQAGDLEAVKYITKVLTSNNRSTREMGYARLSQLFPSMESKFAENFQRRNQGRTWRHEEIADSYLKEYYNIVNQFGLGQNKQTAQLKDLFLKSAYIKQRQVRNDFLVSETETNLGTAIEQFRVNPTNEKWVNLTSIIASGHFRNGQNVVQISQPKDIIDRAQELTIDAFPDEQSQRDFILNSPQIGAYYVFPSEEWVIEKPNGKTVSGRVRDLYTNTDKGNAAKVARFEGWSQKWNEKLKNDAKKNEDALISNARTALVNLESKWSGGAKSEDETIRDFHSDDPATKQKAWEKLVLQLKNLEVYDSVKTKYDPGKFLRSKIGILKPGTYLISSHGERVEKAIIEGDYSEAVDSLRYLDIKDQKFYRDRVLELGNLHTAVKSVNKNKTGNIRTIAASILREDSKISQSTVQMHTSGDALVDTVGSRLVSLFYEGDKNESPEQRLQKAIAQVKKELIDARAPSSNEGEYGTGIFSSIDSTHQDYTKLGGTGIGRLYLHQINVSDTNAYSTEKLKTNPITLPADPKLLTVETAEKVFGNKAIISKSATDELARMADVDKVGVIELKGDQFDNFNEIIKQQPNGSTLTMRRLANLWLEYKGYPQRFPDTLKEVTIDHAVSNGIPNAHKESEKNLIIKCCLNDLKNNGDDDAIKSLYSNQSLYNYPVGVPQ